MNRKHYLLCTIFSLLICTTMVVESAESDPETTWNGLEQMMSSEEFSAAGLAKLSPAERKQLDQWLIQFLAHDSQQVVQTDKTIQKMQQQPVQRRITGHFSGWSGDTIFRLDNGEIWKQRLSGRYFISLDNPEVEISRNLLGFYELRIIKTRRKIGVTRVK